MDKVRKIALFSLVVFSLAICGCSDDESTPAEPNVPPPTQVLDAIYSGSLWLRFSNAALPAFDNTTYVPVDVDQYGRMTFGRGTLPYDGEETMGDFRIKRTGTLTIRPNGKWFDNNGEDYFDVKENTTLNENMKTWVWDGAQWLNILDENITNTFNGGLAFSLWDAVMGSGSVVEESNANGTVRWTLTLIVVDTVSTRVDFP